MTASEDERGDVTGAPARRGYPEFEPRPADDTERNGGPGPAEHAPGVDQSGPAPVAEPDGADSADSAADDSATDEPAKLKKKGSFWKELPILIAIALVLTFLIQTFIARVYVIPSGSMEQTLHGCTGCTGDRILVDKITYDFTDPAPGDVIVFEGPPGWAQGEYAVQGSSNPVVRWLREFGSSIGIGSPPEYDLVKRVIAVGGQTVSCCDKQNRVVVDGKPLTEPYIYWMPGGPTTQEPFTAVTVPKGDLWVMGDNRNDSEDSRYQNGGGINGVVPVKNVIGIARTIIWPPNRWRGIGEINPHAQDVAMALVAPELPGGLPVNGLPLGAGAVAAWPTLWLGRRLGAGLRRRSRRRGRR